MHTINHVLFVSDFSPAAEDALYYSADLARLFNASLTLLNVAEIPFGFTGRVEEYKQKAMEEGLDFLQQKADSLKENKKFEELETGVVMRLGHAISSIIDEAEKGGYDVLIMSTEGAYEGKPLVGSLVSDLILYSPISLLAVPPGNRNCSWNKILFASDFNDKDPEHFSDSVQLAGKTGAELEVVHLLPEAKDSFLRQSAFRGLEQMLREQAPYEALSFKRIYAPDFIMGMHSYIQEEQQQNLSLIVVGRNKRSSFRSLFITETPATQLAFETEVPVLVMV